MARYSIGLVDARAAVGSARLATSTPTVTMASKRCIASLLSGRLQRSRYSDPPLDTMSENLRVKSPFPTDWGTPQQRHGPGLNASRMRETLRVSSRYTSAVGAVHR